ncbi:MAG TPA: TonB-dependent receptor [Flavisolibacter sp.]|nr:TonB-dependent receptor [Flavisolibacter sp.]
MKKYLSQIVITLLMHSLLFAQKQVINGKIVNIETREAVPSATISSRDGKSIVNADEKGSFSITVPSLPVVLIFSSAGMQTKEVSIFVNQSVTVELLPHIKMEDPVVVGADRKPVRLLQTATSLEAVTLANINVAPGSYYDLLARKKGVDETTSSMTFKTISTRGFNGSGSTRVNQLVDGMDNQAPGLNFFLGHFLGLTELDVESMEILPGASSALYGPGGINGTILINSKNPFKHQGLSILFKEGINHLGASNRGKSEPYHDFSLRYAKAFNNKFAFKIGAQYLSATDWLASDTSNYIGAGPFGKVGPGTRQSDPNYNGVNVYGDETSVDIYPFLLAMGDPNPEHMFVSRTGYHEKDVIDPETKNIKLSGSLNYKLTSNIETLLMGYWATGNSVYTGNNRYALKDVKLGQYKFEIKHPDWFIRSYTTQEDAGEAFTATGAMQVFNEVWKPSYNSANPAASWYPQFSGAYLQARMLGADKATALNIARGYADQGRPEPGSDQYNQIFNQVRKTPIPSGGLFREKSQLWMTEGQYNFKQLKFADIIVGGNYKKYILDSDGTLFIDTPEEPIKINELGAYAQISKRLFSEMLTLSVSGRLDKNEDFKEQFTPRVTTLFKVAKDNFIRASYQTAYRFPSTQQKYIRLNVGSYEILGGLPWVMDYMEADKNQVVEFINGAPASIPYEYKEFKPENMTSYEVGYRGLIAEKLLIDAYGYWGQYENFLGRNILFQPATGKVFSTVVNSPTKVKTYGFGIGADYKLGNNFSAFINGFSDKLTDVPTGFQAFFNAPEYRFNAGIANSGFGKNKEFGFNVNFRWQDDFMWDGELANGPVKSFSTIDAQVSYNIKNVKSTFRLGGTNIFNKYYKNAYGNPEIGGLYYIAYAFNL